jgi:hypothetical protein
VTKSGHINPLYNLLQAFSFFFFFAPKSRYDRIKGHISTLGLLLLGEMYVNTVYASHFPVSHVSICLNFVLVCNLPKTLPDVRCCPVQGENNCMSESSQFLAVRSVKGTSLAQVQHAEGKEKLLRRGGCNCSILWI